MQTVPSELFYQQVGINEKLCHKLEIEHARVEQYAEIERYFVCKNQLQYLEKPLKF